MTDTYTCLICRPLPDRYGPLDFPITTFVWFWEIDRYLVAPLPTYPDQAALAAHLLAAHGIGAALAKGRRLRDRYRAEAYDQLLTLRGAGGHELALLHREGLSYRRSMDTSIRTPIRA
ncbi:MAG TPA: hypothetical protein VFZ66_29725 [Herpetosiphonaceae bacterium]